MDKSPPILLGIIIDVSSSMQRSWNTGEGRVQPKIEIIRDGLNSEFRRLSSLYRDKFKTSGSIDVFCLGMGFKVREEYVSVKTENGFEITLKDSLVSRRSDIVCDIITLAQIIPDRGEIDKLGDSLKLKWHSYADTILKSAVINEDVYGKLREYIRENLSVNGTKHFQGSTYYRMYEFLSKHFRKHRLIERIYLHFKSGVTKHQIKIMEVSEQESKRYIETIQAKSSKIFLSKKANYETYVESQIATFASQQIIVILQSLTLGYSFETALRSFDEEQAFRLAREIYSYLDKDVQEQIKVAWQINKTKFALVKKSINAIIDDSEVKRISELCVQKYGWQILQPFIENIVYSIFTNQLISQIDELTQYWLNISTYYPQTMSIKNLAKILPESYGNTIYSEKFMFGITPAVAAIDKATIRFLAKPYKNRKKVLLLISDGDFDSDALCIAKLRMLKAQGVIIVCGYVGGNGVTPVNLGRSKPGARLMWEVASRIQDDSYWQNKAYDWGIELLQGGKLFFHLNQADSIQDLMNYLVGLKE